MDPKTLPEWCTGGKLKARVDDTPLRRPFPGDTVLTPPPQRRSDTHDTVPAAASSVTTPCPPPDKRSDTHNTVPTDGSDASSSCTPTDERPGDGSDNDVTKRQSEPAGEDGGTEVALGSVYYTSSPDFGGETDQLDVKFGSCTPVDHDWV